MHRPTPVPRAVAVSRALNPPDLGGRARLAAGVAAVAIATALAVQAVLSTGGHRPRHLDVLGAVLLVAAAAFLVGRDLALARAVGACLAAAVYTAAGYPSPAQTLAPAVALAAAAQVTRLRWIMAVGGGCIAAGAVGSHYGPSPSAVGPRDVLLAITSLVALVGVADAVRMNSALATREGDYAELARQARITDEKVRIVRDVHAHVASEIARMSRRARLARHLVDRDDVRAPVEARAALDDVTTRGHDAMEELRVAALLLDDTAAEGLARTPARGLAAVPELLVRLRDSGLRVSVEGDVGRLPRPVDHAAFEVVRAALDNVVRHSTATSADLRMWSERGPGLELLVVEVGDRGPARRGHTIPAAPGVSSGGLSRARVRIEVLGGALISGEDAHGGWSVRAVLPLIQTI